MPSERTDIRLGLPSKGQLAAATLDFLTAAGLQVYKPNPRQFEATIPGLPDLKVLFQRAADIPLSVRDGSVDFGITGWDVTAERVEENNGLLPLLPALGYGHCSLHVIVPEAWEEVRLMADLAEVQANQLNPLRVATKFPRLAEVHLSEHGLKHFRLIHADGTLEAAPAIGYADVIVDLVSSGTTLRDNRLRALEDGTILTSQACLIANRSALTTRPLVLEMARQILDILVAHLRASENVAIFANMRGESPAAIAQLIFEKPVIAGLQGPTISPVFTPQGEHWFAVNIVVKKTDLPQAIAELRSIGGSGVIVTPITYIFEEEPEATRVMLAALEG
jgi:ATP phosphoribosyltransferase